jgi:hypothetical protein
VSSAALLQFDLTDAIREQLFPTSVSEWLLLCRRRARAGKFLGFHG